MTAQWYAMFSKPRKELQVASYLRSHALEVYHPVLRVKPVNPRAARVRSYFPRYLFVHADLQEVGVGTFQWCLGASGLVQFDNTPAVVPEHFIQALQERLQVLEARGGLAPQDFRSGDTVVLKTGPFAGYEAIFDARLSGTERVQVLLHWLGREIKVQLHASGLEKQPGHQA
ncbi:MAG: hypothetical protein HC915_03800 [Anaerolineae bacterium]|nr:hypothetical protein [Anaerolineae bacterium]